MTFFTLHGLQPTSCIQNNSSFMTSSGDGCLDKQKEQTCKYNIYLLFRDYPVPQGPSVRSIRSATESLQLNQGFLTSWYQ